MKPVPPAPVGEVVEVVDAASLPTASIGPNRILFLAAGLGAGLLIGLLTMFVIRMPRTIFALAAFAIAGGMLAMAASLLIPNRYTSTAVMTIRSLVLAGDPPGILAPAISAEEFLQEAEPEVLSYTALTAIIQDPRLNLYPRERQRKPIKEVVGNMLAHDLHVGPSGERTGKNGATSQFIISFTYPDNLKAQQVVQGVVTMIENAYTNRGRLNAGQSVIGRSILQHRGGENLEVLDAPSRPMSPVWPNRWTIIALGLVFGLVTGLIVLAFRRSRTSSLHPA